MLFYLLASKVALAADINAAQRYALIYNGPVADAESVQAVAEVARAVGLGVRYVDDLRKLSAVLPQAKVFIIGGTEDDVAPLMDGFTLKAKRALYDYLDNGGRYLGICGGAYVASSGWRDEGRIVRGLNIIEAKTDGYDEDFESKVYRVNWQGQVRSMYYQAGPVFKPGSEKPQIIATYPDGRPAALIADYGRGRVAVSGPHPEAPPAWRENLDEDEKMDSNIDLAQKLFVELLDDQ